MAPKSSNHTVTLSTRIGNGPITETVTEYTIRRGPGCKDCNFEGEILYFYERPGSPPGNQMIPCPECYKDKESGSAEVRAALDELKVFDGG